MQGPGTCGTHAVKQWNLQHQQHSQGGTTRVGMALECISASDALPKGEHAGLGAPWRGRQGLDEGCWSDASVQGSDTCVLDQRQPRLRRRGGHERRLLGGLPQEQRQQQQNAQDLACWFVDCTPATATGAAAVAFILDLLGVSKC